jgi:hypothetical protein
MMGKPLTPTQVQKAYGHTPAQMRTYERQGYITADRTPGGHRRYDEEAVRGMFEKGGDQVKPGQVLTPKARYQEFGTTGLRQWSGSVYEERLRNLRGRTGRIEYREMRRNDPVIAGVFFGVLNALKQADVRIAPASDKPPDIEVAEFVDSCLIDMAWSWMDQFTFATEPTLEQGFSLLEVVYKRRLGLKPPKYTADPAKSRFNDGRIGWRKLPPRPAESLAPGREWEFDESGGIQGVWQQPEANFSGKGIYFIPIEKLLHFRTTVHPANNPEGEPIHRAMYVPFYYTKNIQEIEGIGIERDAVGVPTAYMGRDMSQTGAGNDYDKLKEVVTNLRIDEQHGIVLPYAKMGEGAAEGEGVLLELLSMANSGQRFDTNEILNRYDQRKAVSVLAQFIMLGSAGKTGSYALSRHQGDIFTLAVSAFLDSIADIFNRHGISRLMALNSFPRASGLPHMTFSTVGVPDLDQLSNYVNRLVDKQVIRPDDELERHLRQTAGLPEISEESVRVVEPAARSGKGGQDIQKQGEDEDDRLEREAGGITDRLQGDIDAEFEDFKRNVAEGMAIAAAILLFKRKIKARMEGAYTSTWLVGRGDNFSESDEAQIQQALDGDFAFLDNFMIELQNEARDLGQKEVDELLGRRKARALMYAGGAWAMFNRGKVFGRPQEELWVWSPQDIDEHSCSTCKIEAPKDPRPLSQMLIPAVDTACKTNCRHSVRRVR